MALKPIIACRQTHDQVLSTSVCPSCRKESSFFRSYSLCTSVIRGHQSTNMRIRDRRVQFSDTNFSPHKIYMDYSSIFRSTKKRKVQNKSSFLSFRSMAVINWKYGSYKLDIGLTFSILVDLDSTSWKIPYLESVICHKQFTLNGYLYAR